MQRLAGVAFRCRANAARALARQMGTIDLKGFGADAAPLAIGAAGALLALREHDAAGGARACALAARRGGERIRRDGCGDAPQPRDHADARRRTRAHALLAARHVRERRRKPAAAPLAHASAARSGARRRRATRRSMRCVPTPAAMRSLPARAAPNRRRRARRVAHRACAARGRATSPGCATRWRCCPTLAATIATTRRAVAARLRARPRAAIRNGTRCSPARSRPSRPRKCATAA